MIETKKAVPKPFLNDRLTYRLQVLAEDMIAANDQIFVDLVGCSIREVRVLRLIDDHAGITFVDICKLTGIERSQTSRLIRRLLNAGLVERRNVDGDARRFGLKTTELGRVRRQQSRILSDRLEAIMFQPLAGHEIAALKSLLDRLAEWSRAPDYLALLADFRKSTKATDLMPEFPPSKAMAP